MVGELKNLRLLSPHKFQPRDISLMGIFLVNKVHAIHLHQSFFNLISMSEVYDSRKLLLLIRFQSQTNYWTITCMPSYFT